MSKPPAAHTAAAAAQQQQQQGKAVHFEHTSSSVFAAGVPASVTAAGDRPSPTHAAGMQHQGSLDAWLAAAGSSSGTVPGSALGSAAGLASGFSGSAGLGSAGSAVLQQLQQLQQQQQQHVVPLEQHPNLATAGGPGSAPLGVLQVTLQVWLGGAEMHTTACRQLQATYPHALELLLVWHKEGGTQELRTHQNHITDVSCCYLSCRR
jgi:hypothetical protein